LSAAEYLVAHCWIRGRLGIGKFVGDVIVTREIAGLMQNLLVTDSPPAGQTRLLASQHAATLGVKYASELARRRDRSGLINVVAPPSWLGRLPTCRIRLSRIRVAHQRSAKFLKESIRVSRYNRADADASR
jgi:hypothetical protein